MENLKNILSAGLSGQTVQEYIKTKEAQLRKLKELEELVNSLKVLSIEDYQYGMQLKSVLDSLWCFAFNNDKDEKPIAEIENKLWKKLEKFAKKYVKIPPELKPVAHYATANLRYYYPSLDDEKMVKDLLPFIRKDENSFFLVGLHKAIGDNCFGISRTGKEYRLYVKTCGIQAFYINSIFENYINHYLERHPETKISQLDNFFKKTPVGNWKGSARIYLSRKEKDYLFREYRK